MSPKPNRRADIDWLRIAAFGLLIFYHVGLVYGPWDWHVNSVHRVEGLRYAALLLNPWRLTLLFFISGVALRLMSARATPGRALKARVARLAPPFAFGVLFLVPPQAWLEALDKGSFSEGLVAWWLTAFSPAGIVHGVPINHLWFVLYIGVYSLFALALLAAPRVLAKLDEGVEWLLSGWKLFFIPLIYLAACRRLLWGTFGVSNHLLSDWYNHAASLGVFLLGFCLAERASVWQSFARLRWVFLVAAILAMPALMALEGKAGLAEAYARDALFPIVQWGAVGAALGFARHFLHDAHGPALRYLSAAVFPCYLAHQTILVMAAFVLKPMALPLPLEATLLVLATLGGSIAVYEVVRRVPAMGPLWGFRPPRASVTAGTAAG